MINNIKRWKCLAKTCKVYFKMKWNDDILVKVNAISHDHEVGCTTKSNNKSTNCNSLKSKGTQKLHEKPTKLMYRHLKENIDVSVKNTRV